MQFAEIDEESDLKSSDVKNDDKNKSKDSSISQT